jgi:hypothetical protein
MRRLVIALGLAASCGAMLTPPAGAATTHHAAPRPPRGFTIVNSSDFVAPAGEQTRGFVACPSGLVPLSGSAAIFSVSVLTTVDGSFPVGNDWVVDVNNASASDVTFETVVACAHQPRNYAVVTGPTMQSQSGTQIRAAAECPHGSKPLGGGVASGSFSVFVNINSTFPSGHLWVTHVNNASADEADVEAVAVCGMVPGYSVAIGSAVINHAQTHTLSFATCPAQTVAIGGGAGSNSPSVGVNIGGMGLAGSEFDSFMNNASGVDFLSSTFAICAGR